MNRCGLCVVVSLFTHSPPHQWTLMSVCRPCTVSFLCYHWGAPNSDIIWFYCVMSSCIERKFIIHFALSLCQINDILYFPLCACVHIMYILRLIYYNIYKIQYMSWWHFRFSTLYTLSKCSCCINCKIPAEKMKYQKKKIQISSSIFRCFTIKIIMIMIRIIIIFIIELFGDVCFSLCKINSNKLSQIKTV